MDDMLSTDAHITIPAQIQRFLKSNERAFMVAAPSGTGRRTTVNEALKRLNILDKARWCESEGPAAFYDAIADSVDSPLLIIVDDAVACSRDEVAAWYADAIGALRVGKPITGPSNGSSGGVVRNGPTIVITGAPDESGSRKPFWTDFPGVHYDESPVDLYNHLQRERARLIADHGLDPDAFDTASGKLREACLARPEYCAVPTPQPRLTVERFIEVVVAANGVTESLFNQGETRSESQPSRCLDLRAFHVLDGVRGRLLLPRMIETFCTGDDPIMGVVARYRSGIGTTLRTVLAACRRQNSESQEDASEDPVVKLNDPSHRADRLYRMLAAAGPSDVVVARFGWDFDLEGDDAVATLAILEAIRSGRTIRRPVPAEADLPSVVDFQGKLIITDETIPRAERMQHLLCSIPGVAVVESFSDLVHRQAWRFPETVDHLSDAIDGSPPESPRWYRYLSSLFRFIEQTPTIATKRSSVEVGEQLLIQAFDAIANDTVAFQSRGDMHTRQIKSRLKEVLQEAPHPWADLPARAAREAKSEPVE